jgi:uncharacterized LabA/DUF88 family protein
MYHSAKNLFGSRVNYKEVLRQAVAERRLIQAHAYVIKSQAPEEQGFFDVLESQGFNIRIKDLQIFAGGAKKGDWDVGIAVDAIKLADKVDAIVLVTGDGDFVPLVRYLQENKGCQVEVMAFQESSSAKLVEEADDFTDLSEKKYLLKIKK